MLKILEYFDGDCYDLKDIRDTLTPINKDMPHFFVHYVDGKKRYTEIEERKFKKLIG